MNYREQQMLRDIARAAGRGDLIETLDKAADELDEASERTRDAHRAWRAASDDQDAKAGEVREIQKQIRDLGKPA